ncbi:hypothetical protein GCM10022394_24760 [Zobellella aerophila]|uniref:Uncharacterized protein n=1 Tax=Zobellella aerophila TaxID=870480 RepID=A0ABP6W2T2_9GAMM
MPPLNPIRMRLPVNDMFRSPSLNGAKDITTGEGGQVTYPGIAVVWQGIRRRVG